MGKKIQSAADYSVHMINVMAEHDKHGAMEDWVYGTVRTWLKRLLENIEQDRYQVSSIDNLEPDASDLVMRTINSIKDPSDRSVLISTCLSLNIITTDQVTPSELDYVNIIPVDQSV